MQMKQLTSSQKWYDRLCRIYSIGDFPPLHSFSFTDWHWIDDDDLEKNRSFKMIPSASFSDDFWAMIVDDDDEQLPRQPTYSDAVQRSSPVNVIFRSSNKRCHSTRANWKKKKVNDLYAKTTMDDDDDDDDIDQLWSQYKDTHRRTMHSQHHRVGRRGLKSKMTSMRSCLVENAPPSDKSHLDGQKGKQGVRKVTHQRKSPIRLVRHQNRHCAHRYR